jgi:tRNA(adenine34) deaminase
MPDTPIDLDRYMRLALDQAQAAWALNEVPVGAIVVDADGKVIAADHNRRQSAADPTAHAEILVLRQAAASRNDWRLDGCTLFVTLEPCPMCAGAVVNARITTVVYGCPDPKAGAAGTLLNLCNDPRLNHRARIVPGILSAECAKILSDFFQQQRAAGKK